MMTTDPARGAKEKTAMEMPLANAGAVAESAPGAPPEETGGVPGKPAPSREEMYIDQLQRLQAEFDNYRKRVAREQQQWMRDAKAELVVQLLPVIDNFERAMEIPDIPKNIQQGLEMVHQELRGVLHKEGIRCITTVQQPFDPNYHEAIAYQETAAAEGTIIHETVRGYVMGEKLLRAAQVVVAKAAEGRSSDT